MSPWKVILATMVIFICGLVTGSLLTKTLTLTSGVTEARQTTNSPQLRVPTGAVAQMQKVLDKQLDLTADQREQVGKIMKASQERTRPLWEKIAPQMQGEVKEVREEIRGVLTPEQWKKFTDLMKRNRKPNTPPPGDSRPPHSVESSVATNAL